MALSNTNLSLLALVTLFLMLANKVTSDGTSFTYDSFSTTDRTLTFQGTARTPSASGVLRLTEEVRGSVGRVVYSNPVLLWDSSRLATFETTIRFNITHTGNNPADGITFFIAPVGTTIPTGSSGGNLGIFPTSGSQNQVVAVEIDTFRNGWDPNSRHIGIDVNSRNSVNTTNWQLVSGQMVTARINYDANLQRLSVHVTAFPQSPRLEAETYVLTYERINLRNILPSRVQVGLSGSTGDHVAIHEIRSWYFSSYPVYTAKEEKEDMYIAQYV